MPENCICTKWMTPKHSEPEQQVNFNNNFQIIFTTQLHYSNFALVFMDYSANPILFANHYQTILLQYDKTNSFLQEIPVSQEIYPRSWERDS